jgi:hypothetical protein
MTIAVAVKVNDGFVLSADSATTLQTDDGDGHAHVVNIYNNANKVFNLHKGLPIGAMTWGLGNIGPASIATLAKDLRRRFYGQDRTHADWRIERDSYTMRGVAERVKHFFCDEKYEPLLAGGSVPGALGLLVAGYGADQDDAELYTLTLDEAGCHGPEPVLAGTTGAAWWGQPEAITRMMLGISTSLPNALVNLGVPDSDAVAYAQAIQSQVQTQLVSPAMPIQDAIDLAEFLVRTTIQFVRFSPGDPTVGGPVETAAITKHERFKWVRRKHYYEARLNPMVEAS